MEPQITNVGNLAPAMQQAFFDNHEYNDELQKFGASRVLQGYYIKDAIKVKFYYKPSWWSRQKMYWFAGWSWKDVGQA